MNTKLERSRIGDGVYFGTISDKKFKHNRISINFILPLDRARASDNAVVPHILRMGSDFTALNARLQELYGATLDADVMKFGGYQVLEITVRALDNRYALDGEDLTGACAALLRDIALDPRLENGLFPEKEVALQRQYVLDAIEAEINDKRSYAISQCVQTMCEGEPVAVRRYGYPETAAAITPESATAAYREMLRTAPVEILFTGAGESAPAVEVFRQAFAGIARAPGNYEPVRLRPDVDKVREKVEEMELSQSKLVMGMRCGEVAGERERLGMRLFASMFGGTPFSKLFLNVRERLSLCYYCAARFDVTTNLLLVDSGIEYKDRKAVEDEVMAQLEAVAGGEFTDDELAETKLLLNNSLLTINDSLGSMESWYLSHILRGQAVSPEEDAAALNTVTREEIVAAAKAVKLDTVYFLAGKEAEDNE